MVWGAIAGATLGAGLSAFSNYQKEKQAREDYRHARERAFGQLSSLESEPALAAARQSVMQDINQPTGIAPEAQRQMFSQVRGTVAGQQAGQLRALNEGLASRGLLGSSTELANRQAIGTGAIGAMAQGRTQLALESEAERSRRQQMARQQALGIAGARTSFTGAASGLLGAQTGGLAALLGKFQRPDDIGQAAQGGAKLGKMFE